MAERKEREGEIKDPDRYERQIRHQAGKRAEVMAEEPGDDGRRDLSAHDARRT